MFRTLKTECQAQGFLRRRHLQGMLAIFTYGFDIASSNFDAEGVNLHTLSDYDHLIQQASETDYIRQSQLQTLLQWKSNPQQWKP